MSALPLFPLQHALFPEGSLQLQVFEVRYLHLVRRCVEAGMPFGVVGLLSGNEVRSPEGTEVLAHVGTLAHVQSNETVLPGLMRIQCRGGERFRLLQAEVGQYGLWMGQAEPLPQDPAVPVPDSLQSAVQVLERVIDLGKAHGASWLGETDATRLDDAGWVANRLAEAMPLDMSQKAALLLMNDPVERLTWIHDWIEASGK
ncbi:MAG: LON peptidase substrate-binding domain-containing protein [Pigmentiphaga sp.]